MREGFIYGLLTALAVSVPVMLVDHLAIIPAFLVFMSGGLFSISIGALLRADK